MIWSRNNWTEWDLIELEWEFNYLKSEILVPDHQSVIKVESRKDGQIYILSLENISEDMIHILKYTHCRRWSIIIVKIYVHLIYLQGISCTFVVVLALLWDTCSILWRYMTLPPGNSTEPLQIVPFLAGSWV